MPDSLSDRPAKLPISGKGAASAGTLNASPALPKLPILPELGSLPELAKLPSDLGASTALNVGLFISAALTLILAASLIKAFRVADLPLRFSWRVYVETYWLSLAAKAILISTLLYVLAFPHEETIAPIARRYRQSKLRCGLALAGLVCFVWIFGAAHGVVLTIDAVAIGEFFDRTAQCHAKFMRAVANVIVPAAYFFFGFILVMSYNDVVAALRFDGSYDVILNRVDSWLLFGGSVIGFAGDVVPHLPHAALLAVQWIYALMFPLVGVCILYLGLEQGMRRALQFVATLMTAYYVALIIFYFVPAAGPFVLSKAHATVLPGLSLSHGVKASLEAFAMHKRPAVIGLDFFIGFPSLHAAIPVIAMWYLRRWRRIVWLLGAYYVALIPAILVLQEHYVVDLIGGVALAILAIGIAGGFAAEPPRAAAARCEA